MRSRRKTTKPDTMLAVLLRIEKLLQAPQTIEDRVAAVSTRLLKYKYRWRYTPADRGSIALYTLTNQGGVQVAMVRAHSRAPDWRVGSDEWTEAPTINHALIAASECALAELEGR